MKRFEIFVGHNYDDGAHTWAPETVLQAIAAATHIAGVDGFTLIDAQGYWHGKPERTTIVILIDCGPHTVREIASFIAQRLCQECVLVCESECQSALVGQT